VIRTVHHRSVRPKRRNDPSRPFAPKNAREEQVFARCDAWVPKRDTVRDIKHVSCAVCMARAA